MARRSVVQVIPGPFELPDWVPRRLAAAGIDFSLHDCRTREDIQACAREADIVWAAGGRRGLLTGDNFDVLERCVAIVRSGSGTDNVDVEAATARGILVSNTPDAVTEPLADHTIALLFSLVRRVSEHDRRIRRGVWDSFGALPHRAFKGATLGFVGFGRAPRRIIGKLSGFGMSFLAFTRTDEETIRRHGAEKVDMATLLACSDYVSLHCALTEKTRNLIGRAELSAMQPHGLLINTSRGSVVDEEALVDALRTGSIAGAALDVLVKEPPDADNPLLAMDNVILTPHSGGHSHIYPQELCEASVATIMDILEDRLPSSIVNPEIVKHRRKLRQGA